jgi:hypothetical protein
MGADFGDISLIVVGSDNAARMAAFFEDAKAVAGIVQPQFMSDGKSG